MTPTSRFLDALAASQRSPELADGDDLFGWLIGSWEVDAVLHDPSGKVENRRGEVHALWVLEGRAIQDVSIFPRRIDRLAGVPRHGDRYATTIRTYDRTDRVWPVNFINPAADETSAQLVARSDGGKIVMDGTLSDGTPIRWRYDEFGPEAFHYSGERLRSDGSSGQVYLELFGRHARSVNTLPKIEKTTPLRSFDFCLGAWNVIDRKSSKPLGMSQIDTILDGRVLHERWTGLDGSCGESFNLFQTTLNRWHQSWVGNEGVLLLLDGGIHEGAMDLQGKTPDGAHHRIRWWPQSDGGVLQLWESSRDGGSTWECLFEGLYRRT